MLDLEGFGWTSYLADGSHPPLAQLCLLWLGWPWAGLGAGVSPDTSRLLSSSPVALSLAVRTCLLSVLRALSSHTQLTDFLLRLRVWWKGEGCLLKGEVNKIPQVEGWASVLCAPPASLAPALGTRCKALGHSGTAF